MNNKNGGDNSNDLKSLQILAQETNALKNLPSPPQDYEKVEDYERTVGKTVDHAWDTVKQIGDYADKVFTALENFRALLGRSTTVVKQVAKKLVKEINPTPEPAKGTTKPMLEALTRLEKLEQKKQRLEEALLETEERIMKIQDGAALTKGEVKLFKGIIFQWTAERKEGYREEQQRKEREKQQKIEDERRKEEEEIRKRKEEAEERIRMEQEWRRKLEEEKKRKEEEKKLQREEELRRKQEEKMRLLEEKRLEEEALKRRMDPNNWQSYIYTRKDADGASISFDNGECCRVAAMTGTLDVNQLQCYAFDEEHETGRCVSEDEKLVSSLITVLSKAGEIEFETPIRLWIPHCPILDKQETLVVKVAIDGGEWEENIAEINPNNTEIKLAGVDIKAFERISAVVVAKARTEILDVGQAGMSEVSTIDRYVKLFIPRDTFGGPTKVKLQIRQVKEDSVQLASKRHKSCENVLSTSSLVTLMSSIPAGKQIEVDLSKPPSYERRTEKGKLYHVFKPKDSSEWKFAETEVKSRRVVSLKLPEGKDKYHVLELEVRPSATKEEVLKAAEELYQHINGTLVKVIVRQSKDNQASAIIECVQKEFVDRELQKLEKLGYTFGPDCSREFCVLDGEYVEFECTGNIGMKVSGRMKFKQPFHAYMNMITQEVSFDVIDRYKQRDEFTYMGNVTFAVEKWQKDGTKCMLSCGYVPITLPKVDLPSPRKSLVPLQLQHHLLALAKFVAIRLAADDAMWDKFMITLSSRRYLSKLRRLAYAKCSPNDEYWRPCEIMLNDWMKSKTRNEDKVGPIFTALKKCSLLDVLEEAVLFERIHREFLNTKSLQEISSLIGPEWTKLADKLGFSRKAIDEFRILFPDSTADQVYEMLCNWRMSDDAINSGDRILDSLLGAVENVSFNIKLIDKIEVYLRMLETRA